jgi:RNA polymerase sigma factor (sigma-70 family)
LSLETLLSVGARRQAIEVVYRGRYRNFRDALATIVGSPDIAHDAVQQAFAIAIASRRSFRGGSLEAWIWRIALRTAVRTRHSAEPVVSQGELAAPAVDAERDPQLVAALRRLTPRRRLIVFLRYFGDLSYESIAEVCGISEGTVAATLAQARAELEADLKEAVR